MVYSTNTILVMLAEWSTLGKARILQYKLVQIYQEHFDKTSESKLLLYWIDIWKNQDESCP